jgi:hypothetical protein
VRQGQHFNNLKFSDYRISCSVSKSKSASDTRAIDLFQTATLDFNTKSVHKFSRIDGNHRLSATPKDKKFETHNTPFCLIFFRNTTEAAQFSRALFHNINYKSVPLTMEQNLKLILDDPALFPDDKLKNHESFGWPYYLARHLNNKLDFDLLSNIKPFIANEPRTFLVRQFEYLIEEKILNENDNAIVRFKQALGNINNLFNERLALKDSKNVGLLAALLYYDLSSRIPVSSFVRWVVDNHLHLIANSHARDLIAIFDKILESRKRTIFVSMPFGKEATENHFKTINRVAEEINKDYPHYRPPLRVVRVDFQQTGTSFNIRAKIDEFMENCGLLIGDLTYCNPNVYHEIGFMDGKAKAEGRTDANVLLFLDESVPEEKDRLVGFNLRGTKYISFKQSEEFARILRDNLERFFNLKT